MCYKCKTDDDSYDPKTGKCRSCNPDFVFDEKELYKEICKVWGEYGAHAEVFRDLAKKAGLPI